MEEVFPGQDLLKGVSLAFLTSLLYSGGIALEAFIENMDNFEITPLMLTSWGVTTVMGIGEIKLLLDRRKFRKHREETDIREDYPSPEELYNEAEEFMARGDLDSAFSSYSEILTGHPESTYMPLALYKLSKINIVNGSTSLAKAGLEELFYNYPLPEIFDKVCHSLAGLYAKENKLEKSGEYLEAMLYLDPLYTRAGIEEYRTDILTRDISEEGVPSE